MLDGLGGFSLTEIIAICFAMGIIAILYSCVGHAGASGYIAVLTLAEFSPTAIKPTALLLNIGVSTIVCWQFLGRGYFSWPLYWRFALPAIPLAFLGGYWAWPSSIFNLLVGLVLLFSSFRLLFEIKEPESQHTPSLSTTVPLGGGLGLLAGLTGTGGGIFLTPLLLVNKWAKARQAAGVSALFIWTNSVAGLLGNYSSVGQIPSFAIIFLVVVAVGGALGSYLGCNRLSAPAIKRVLALVLLIASYKLIVKSFG